MFLAEKLWPLFLAHLKVNQIISQSVHKYNKSDDRIVLSASFDLILYKIKLFASFIFVSLLGLQFALYHDSFPIVTQAQCIFFILSYGSHAIISGELLRRSSDFASLVNAMIKFEKSFNPQMWAPKNGNAGKKARHAILPFLPSPPLFALFVGMYIWKYPCFPGNLGFKLLEQCSQENIPTNSTSMSSIAIKAGLILFQAWMANFIVANSCYYAGQYAYSVSHSISSYLVMLWRKKCVVGRNSSRNSSTNNVCRSYTMIRLLTLALNDLNGNILPVIVGSNTLLLVISLFSMLSSKATEFQFVFLSISAIDRLVVIKEAFGTMGAVNNSSLEALVKIKRICLIDQPSKLSRRILRSLPELKVSCGWISYFDATFAPSNINWIVTQTVGFLLMLN